MHFLRTYSALQGNFSEEKYLFDYFLRFRDCKIELSDNRVSIVKDYAVEFQSAIQKVGEDKNTFTYSFNLDSGEKCRLIRYKDTWNNHPINTDSDLVTFGSTHPNGFAVHYEIISRGRRFYYLSREFQVYSILESTLANFQDDEFYYKSSISKRQLLERFVDN